MKKKNIDWDAQLNYFSQAVTKASAFLDKKKIKLNDRQKYIVILYI